MLGNIIGVGDTSGSGFKSGMSGMGNSDSSVRMWAGKNINADGTITDAPFMVQQDGTATLSKAKITANDGSNSIKIESGTIKLIDGTNTDTGAVKTVISSMQGGSIAGILGKLSTTMVINKYNQVSVVAITDNKDQTIAKNFIDFAWSDTKYYGTQIIVTATNVGIVNIPSQTISCPFCSFTIRNYNSSETFRIADLTLKMSIARKF